MQVHCTHPSVPSGLDYGRNINCAITFGEALCEMNATNDDPNKCMSVIKYSSPFSCDMNMKRIIMFMMPFL